MSKSFFIFWILPLFLFFPACAQKRIVKYESLLNRMVGVSKKTEVNQKIGNPTFCNPVGDNEVCEYRTPKSHNENIPVVLQKANGFPDLSPYEYFDVLHLTYNPQKILTAWEAVVLAP